MIWKRNVMPLLVVGVGVALLYMGSYMLGFICFLFLVWAVTVTENKEVPSLHEPGRVRTLMYVSLFLIVVLIVVTGFGLDNNEVRETRTDTIQMLEALK